MNILVIGAGGREHALIWKLKQSPEAENLYSIPGNGGISRVVPTFKLPVEFDTLRDFVREKEVDFILVGPEVPLVDGVVDFFRKEKVKIFGPDKEAARLEGSKVFAKIFLKNCGIATAGFEVFEDKEKALAYLGKKNEIVIKADGLCAGKGVVVADDYMEAHQAIEQMMGKKVFGEAGERVVIEEKLKGEEASILILLSGNNYSFLIPAQDHKPIFADDLGPNSGGMGSYAPTSVISGQMLKKIERKIIQPLMQGLERERINYQGVLYLGLMINNGEPFVLEFNVRFGDPEIEAILPLMEDDLLEVLLKVERGEKVELKWKKGYCVDVVLASGGYPGSYPRGIEIKGLDGEMGNDVYVFHAGTEFKDGKFYTSGGRVLNVAALGPDILKAREKAYQAISQIHFEGMHYRKDIGNKEIKRLNRGVKWAGF